MRPSHTPGPWRVDPPQGAYGYEVLADSALICQMSPILSRDPAAPANAALIAAAPKMFAVLREVLTANEEQLETDAALWSRVREALTDAGDTEAWSL